MHTIRLSYAYKSFEEKCELAKGGSRLAITRAEKKKILYSNQKHYHRKFGHFDYYNYCSLHQTNETTRYS